jgi:cytochrome c biogenesis protein
VRRRRLFLRISPVASGEDGRTVVAVGGLARTDSGSFGTEFSRLVERLRTPDSPRKD